LSFTSPAAFWTVPFALSSFPSACIFLLPVTLPTASLTTPLTLLTAPRGHEQLKNLRPNAPP
jgi:hypothetical protein